MSRLGILTVDDTLAIRSWDAWIAAATGVPAARALGQPLEAIAPDVARRGLLARFRQVLATGEVQVLAPAFHHYLLACPPAEPSPNFDRMQQRVTLGPIRDGDQITGVIATIEDVTARLDRERAVAAALRDADWQARRAAVEELARDADRDLLQSLIDSLRHEHRNFNVLSSALQLLSVSDVDVTEPLAALLEDEDPDLRIQAALALGDRQTPAAVDALVRALADPDVNVRFHAIEALGKLRAGDAVDALAEIASGDDFFLVFPAVDALARIGDGRAAPALVPLLVRPGIAEPVAEALGEIGGADVVRPLVALLNTAGPATAVTRALGRLHQRYEERYGGGALIIAEFEAAVSAAGAARILDAVAACDSEDLRSVVRVLGWLRGGAVHRALAQLLGKADVRAEAIESIVRQDADIVGVLVEQLDSADPDTQLAAIVALGRIGDRRAALPIARLLGGARPVVLAAAAALARIGDARVHESLLPLLAHADAAVRQAAVGALNSLGHPGLASHVLRLLQSEDATERESAVRIAGYFGFADAVAPLLAHARDPEEAVRRAVVEHLPYLDDPRAAAVLAAAVRDESPRVRAAAAQALSHAASEVAQDPLLAASADEDAWVRYYAVRALGQLGLGAGRLAAVAETDPAMHVRIAAIEALGGARDGETIDLLLARATSDVPDLAAAAVRGLGRSEDPRAASELRAALRSPHAAVRLAAVTALRTAGTCDGVAALQWAAAADDDEAIAMAAVEALGAIARRGTLEAPAAVVALIGSTADARTRDAAVGALSRLPDVRIETVARGLAHAQPGVRRAIIAALGRMQRPEASAAIRTALDDDEASVREAAIVALDRLGARGVGRKLALMAREDPSRAVRRAAAAARGDNAGAR